HVLGGFGLPHAETHAIILPQVTRFNLAGSPEVEARLAAAFGGRDPAATLAAMLQAFPIPRRLSELGFDRTKIESAAEQVAAIGIRTPRPATAANVRALLAEAF
ncbi:MAG: maleylacetate reductase, partial [Rhodocyclaceae bacterium]|nr:maleylacetate reductase [Rhodocyclaceae bacterium]